MKIYTKHIVFKEIVNSLALSLRNLNYHITKTSTVLKNDDDLYIIVGGAEYYDIIPKNYIVFQFEQSGVTTTNNQKDIWFTTKYLDLLQNAQYIWDYSRENITYLSNKYKFTNTMYVPLRYSESIRTCPQLRESEKTIDVLFLGSMSERRKKLLDRLQESNYTIHIARNNLWNQERDKLVAQSKIVLNIQYYDNGILEMPRLTYLLSNGIFVISEKGREPSIASEMSNYLILCSYARLEQQIMYYLGRPDLRKKKTKEFFNNWNKTSFDHSIPLTCFVGQPTIEKNGKNKNKNKNKKNKNKKNKNKITYYIPKNIEPCEHEISKDGYCTLKLPNIIHEELPYVSIVTPTKNRRGLFQLAVHNYLNFVYPRDKLEWIIVDNGEEKITDLLPTPLSKYNIKYIKLESNDRDHDRDPKKPYTIGYVRNVCVENATHDYIVHMDDDDFYQPESVLARVKALIKYQDQGVGCVGSTQVGCYNIINGESVLGSNKLMFLSEASMAYTKQFWQQRSFDKRDYHGEYKAFLMFRQDQIRSIPFQFIIIALTHDKNTTGMLRYHHKKKVFGKQDKENEFSFKMYFGDAVCQIIQNYLSSKKIMEEK